MKTAREITDELARTLDTLADGQAIYYSLHTDEIETRGDGCQQGGECCLVVGPMIAENVDFAELEEAVESFLDGYRQRDNIITARQASDETGITVQRIYELIKDHGAPGRRIGSTWIIPREEFVEWLAKRESPKIGRPPKRMPESE